MPDPFAIDTQVFDRLLAMAGPNIAADLVVQLHTDLFNARIGLQNAQALLDRAQLGAQSHVVIGLAGTMGAVKLQRLARQITDLSANPSGQIAALSLLVLQIIPELNKTLDWLSRHPLQRSIQK